VSPVSLRHVPLVLCDYLVVRLLAVDNPQPADRPRAKKEVGMRHRLLGEDADVHRVAIALDAGHGGALRAALADALAAIGLRDEAVERRWLAGVALRPIDFQ